MAMALAFYAKWEQSKDRQFLELLEWNPKARVVDLGCGDGRFSARVKNRIGCQEMLGIDIDDESLERAERKGITTRKSDMNAPLPLDPESFDVVVSNQVIEHLLYPAAFMKEISRILRADGYAVVSTENLSSWDNVIALALGYTPFSMEFDGGLRKIGNPFSPHEKQLKKDYVHSHLRIFAWNGFIELALSVGFKQEKIIGNGHFLGRLGETLDKKHCRFVSSKLRKSKG